MNKILRSLALTALLATIAHTLPAASTCNPASATPLTPVSNRTLKLAQPKLVSNTDGSIVVSGTVTKQPTVQRTAGTHLNVLFLDASGAILRQEAVSYSPRELKPITRAQPKRTGNYSLTLPSLPPGTAAIRVEAASSAK